MQTCLKETWENVSKDRVRCLLCSNHCLIKKDKAGKCKVRKNIKNELKLTNYAQVISTRIDRLKNRPIYLFSPDKCLSVGLTGCNNCCPYCQNYMISQVENASKMAILEPAAIISSAKEKSCDLIAFTFTEPIVWLEYFIDCARLAHENGLKVCLKTAGNIEYEFMDKFLEFVDVMNVDIKPCNAKFLKACGIKSLDYSSELVKRAISKGIHVEISHLVIEGVNNNFRARNKFAKILKSWNKKDLGIHLLRYYPSYKTNYPVTSDKVLKEFRAFLQEQSYTNVFVKDII